MFKLQFTVLALGITAIVGGSAYLHGDMQRIPHISTFVVTQQTNSIIGAETKTYAATNAFANVVEGEGAEAVKVPENAKHAIVESPDHQAYVIVSMAPDESLYLTGVTKDHVGIPQQIGTLTAPPTDIDALYEGPVSTTAISKVVYSWTLTTAADAHAKLDAEHAASKKAAKSQIAANPISGLLKDIVDAANG